MIFLLVTFRRAAPNLLIEVFLQIHSPGFEPVYKYWWLGSSDEYSYTVNGERASSNVDREWEVEVGFRYFW